MKLRRSAPAPEEGMHDTYAGHCAICGHEGVFGISPERRPVDREFRCGGCRHGLRFQDEAQVLIDEFGDGSQCNLDELVARPDMADLAVYHIGSQGPIRNRLRRLPDYEESRYDGDLPLGWVLADGFRNEDVQQLTFGDRASDLVVSSHVLEHVPDPWAAFAEFRRVLKPGGRMIHSIPTSFPLPPTTFARATLDNGRLVHHADERYHKSPEGVPALVFTDFGADVRSRLRRLGFDAVVRRPHLPVAHARRNAVIVARRTHEEVPDAEAS